MANASLTEQKAALRAAARRYLAQNAPALSEAWGRAMAETLTAHPLWQGGGPVFCFVSTKTEPDTRPLLCRALAEGRVLCVPRTGPEGFMEAVPIPALDVLRPARFGLLEPPASLPALAPAALGLIAAPCLMAGPGGQRLGQGGGYYDRFLARSRCPSVLLCPSALIRPDLPLEAHDRRADLVITEQGVL